MKCFSNADIQYLQDELNSIASNSSGRLGVYFLDNVNTIFISIRGNDSFPLQSVLKLIISAAVFNSVDTKDLNLDDIITLTPAHISPGPQEFATLIRQNGVYKATIEELIRRSVIDSDSTSIDTLLYKIGGISTVQEFLKEKEITAIRIDRSERQLQSDSVGISWRDEYTDYTLFEAAISAQSDSELSNAWKTHLEDPRDKCTPKGMVLFLEKLLSGKLLSITSTKALLSIMEQTITGKSRLKAGIPSEWKVAHKTGTGRTYKGITETVNDVGIIMSPCGLRLLIAVFLSESTDSIEEQEKIIANVAQCITTYYL